MGGIFGKNKRPCVFSRVVYRAKGRRAARVCCDAATWTGDSHFYSARIGRALRHPEPPAATMVLETSGSEFGEEEGDSASSPRAQHSEASAPAAARDTRGAEPCQEPGAKPHPELLEPQGVPGEAQGSPNPQHSSKAEAALRAPGSSLSSKLCCGHQRVTAGTRTTVEVDVHVSAGDHGEPGQGQAAAQSQLLRGAGHEAGAAEDACAEEALWEVAMQKAGDTTAASCPLEEAEPAEDVTDGQGAAQEQGGEETGATPDLQLGQGEISAPPAAPSTPSGAAEMAEDHGHGETAEESPACLPETQQDEEKIQVSSEGEPEEQ